MSFLDPNDPRAARPDEFTRAYLEALFWTEEETLGGAELAPDAYARCVADCAAFQASDAWRDLWADDDVDGYPDARRAGHDLWLTRNGHGAGFWDGDWPEPYGDRLTDAAHAIGPVDAYVGDDGLAYLS